jgi:hypothetical protein
MLGSPAEVAEVAQKYAAASRLAELLVLVSKPEFKRPPQACNLAEEGAIRVSKFQ